MSYSHHSPLKTSRMARRRRLIFFLKISGMIVVAAGIVYGLSWLSYRSFWNIAGVQVTGVNTVNGADVQALAVNDLGGAYGFLFSRSNQIIYPRGKIIRDIEAAFPQVATVRLGVADHELIVDVTERQAAYWWCVAPAFASAFPDPTPVLAPAAAGCYQMDDQGYIFMAAPASSTPPFTFYGRISATSTPIGSFYFGNADDFNKLAGLISGLSNRGLPSDALIDRPDGVDELYLTAGGMIVFDDSQDFGQVAASVAALQANTTILNDTAKLAYVDIRLGNKAFYKLVGAPSVDNTATSSATE